MGSAQRRHERAYRVDYANAVKGADESGHRTTESAGFVDDNHAAMSHTLTHSGHMISGTCGPSEDAGKSAARTRTVTLVEPEEPWTCAICSQRGNTGAKCTICQRPRGTSLKRDYQTVDEITQSVMEGISRNQGDARARGGVAKARISQFSRTAPAASTVPMALTVTSMPNSEMLETLRPAAQAPPLPQLPGAQRTARPEDLGTTQGRSRLARTQPGSNFAAHKDVSQAVRGDDISAMRHTAPPAGLHRRRDRSRESSRESSAEYMEGASRQAGPPLPRRSLGRQENRHREEPAAQPPPPDLPRAHFSGHAGAAFDDSDSHDSLTELMHRCGQMNPAMLQPVPKRDAPAGVRLAAESRSGEADYVPPPRSPVPRPPRGHHRPASPNGPPQPLPQATGSPMKGTQSSPNLLKKSNPGTQSSPNLLKRDGCATAVELGQRAAAAPQYGRSPARASPYREPRMDHSAGQRMGQPAAQPATRSVGQPVDSDGSLDLEAMLNTQMANLMKQQDRLKSSKLIA